MVDPTLPPLKIDGPMPKANVEGKIFSASRLGTWMDCALQAHFQYDLRIQTPQNAASTFGTVLHLAMEHFNDTGDFDGAMQTFKDYWQFPDRIGLDPGYWPKNTSWNSYNDLGKDIITEALKAQKWTPTNVIGTEVMFLVPMGRFWLRGRIDLLDLAMSGKGVQTLRVIDYKSKYKKPTKAELLLDVQFTIYLWAVRQKEFWLGVPGNPEYPGLGPVDGPRMYEQIMELTHRAIWYHLRTQSEIDAGPRADDDFERLYRLLLEVDKADEAGIHIPRIGDACSLCDFRAECPMEIPASLAIDEDDPEAWI